MAKAVEGVLFDIHLDRGDVTGKTWHGQFRAKEVLSFGEQIRIDRLKRDLLGPGPYDGVDPEVMAQAVILSELQVRIAEAPEWWAAGIGHSDTNLLRTVYEAARKVSDDHQKEVSAQGEKDQQALRGERQPAPTPTPQPPTPTRGS